MRDKISQDRALLLHPKIKYDVIDGINKAEQGFPKTVAIRIVQGLRTVQEQNNLYAQGRTKPGPIVTNAKGGSSFHNYALAFDFALLYDKNNDGKYEELSWDVNKDFDKDRIRDWMEVVSVFKNMQFEWGGDWKSIKDLPHLQKTFGYTWQKLFDKYNKKDFITGTSYINI